LQVAILFAIIWSSVAAQLNNTCKLQNQRLEKLNQGLTIQFTLSLATKRSVDYAYDEFEALESQENLVEEIIQSFYSNDTVDIMEITRFIGFFNRSASSCKAINTLYELMAKNNQSERIEIIPLYFKIRSTFNDSNLKPGLKKQYHELNSKLSQLKVKIVNSIVSDIKNRTLERPIKLLTASYVNLRSEDANLFQADLVKQYLASKNASHVSILIDFINIYKSHSTRCLLYEAVWQELQKNGANASMEAMVAWTYASHINDNFQDPVCTFIDFRTQPVYMITLYSKYEKYIENSQTAEIRNWHLTHRMRYIFAEYISWLSSNTLKNYNSIKIFNAIYNLPYMSDTCFAAASFYRMLIRKPSPSGIGSFEHFQTLHLVKNLMNNSGYQYIERDSQKECENIDQGKAPGVFQQLLNGNNTYNCSLLNMLYNNSPLLCTTSNTTKIGPKSIYVGRPQSGGDNIFWNLIVHSTGVRLINHANFTLRYNGGNLTATDEDFDAQFDYFRPRAMSDGSDGLLLMPTSGKVCQFVTSMNCCVVCAHPHIV
jgi:hypothetical protein